MTSPSPRIWVLLGHRTGDNNSLLALAEALRLPFETRTLRFNALRIFTPWLGASRIGLDKASRASLTAPWPDLIIGIGWRSVAAARWIKRQTGGKAKLVRLGNPRANPRRFDLVITTPQYPVRDAWNVMRLPLGMSRFRSPPNRNDAENAFLDALPRPHRLLAIGGPAKYWVLAPRQIAEAARVLAQATEGTIIAVASPRTPQSVNKELRDLGLGNLQIVTGSDPRFSVLLDDADDIHVTGDSVAMLSEAILSGKPVGIVPIELSKQGERLLERDPSGRRDLRRFWAGLKDKGLAGPLGRPIAGNVANPAETAADAVRALLSDRV